MSPLVHNHALTGPRTWAWLAVLGVSLASAPVCAQSADVAEANHTRVTKAIEQPFAWPWQLSVERIAGAMNSRYEIVQERRVLHRVDPRKPETVWVGFEERVRHTPAGRDVARRFQVEFLGFTHTTSGVRSLDEQKVEHGDISEFLFHYQSFRIANAKLAAENYSVRFLGVTDRMGRSVYRVGVIPHVADRAHWQLDLDVETGYPLYRGEFEPDGKLVSEVIVRRFDPAFDAPVEDRIKPFAEIHRSAEQALEKAGYPQVAAPNDDMLPRGYRFQSAKLFPNLLGGPAKVVLVYSDGIDWLSLTVEGGTVNEFAGHTLKHYRDPSGANLSQYHFVDGGVGYLVMGRGKQRLLELAQSIYSAILD